MILWDQYHSLNFPEHSFVPRDSLTNYQYPFDFAGDSIYTNFHDLYVKLRSMGYYIEILRECFLCFNAKDYGTIIVLDSEEFFTEMEILKLQ
jgi:membrane-bound transcription factor site-1 protease